MAMKKDHVLSSCFASDQQMVQSGIYFLVSRFMFQYSA